MPTEGQILSHIEQGLERGFTKLLQGLAAREERRDERIDRMAESVIKLEESVDRMVGVFDGAGGRIPLSERLTAQEHMQKHLAERVTELEDDRKSLVRWALTAIGTAVGGVLLAIVTAVASWFFGVRTP